MSTKAGKYATSNVPLVLMSFNGDQHLEPRDFEIALYGAAIGDGNLQTEFPRRIGELPFRGGVLLPFEGSSEPRLPNLSALFVCNWFDTANRARPGKRFHGLVLHHWRPEVKLPSGTFGLFGELVWEDAPNGCRVPRENGDLCLVARLDPRDGLEFGSYSGDAPW